jgi:hypothetical protein
MTKIKTNIFKILLIVLGLVLTSSFFYSSNLSVNAEVVGGGEDEEYNGDYENYYASYDNVSYSRMDITIDVKNDGVMKFTYDFDVCANSNRITEFYFVFPYMETIYRDVNEDGEIEEDKYYGKISNETLVKGQEGNEVLKRYVDDVVDNYITIGVKNPTGYYNRGDIRNYKVSFDYDMHFNYQDGFDEIYINLLGGTNLKLSNVSFTINLPKDVDFSEYKPYIYAGRMASNNLFDDFEINGNSIFLPLAGCKDGNWVNSYYGFYWTSSLHLDYNRNAYDVNFQIGGVIMNDDSRFNGRSVRPVYGPRTEMANTENGHAYVDLGLSVKWATMNVGASKSEDYGDYFAWGEIAPKEEYSWSTYTYCNGSSSSLTKYNYNSSLGFVDNKTQLELSDDAARANWGGKWRMPTDAELTELREQCTWTWTTENDINGYKVTSRINGKSIFLPAAGNRTGPLLGSVGDGYYWSSSISTEGSPVGAYYLYFLSGSVNRYDGSRDYGQSVRPVCP